MNGAARPAWGCLDAQEMRAAAAGHAMDPAIREHLARCKQCRQVVHELRGDLRRHTREGASYHRSLLARPAFWLLLLVLALVAVAVTVLGPRLAVLVPRKPPSAQPQPAVTPQADPQPVAAPAQRPTPRRSRPRRSAGSPGDAAIIAVIRSNQTGIRMCYESALKRDPRLSARLEVRVNVSVGVVERVSLDGLPDTAPLADCIRNVIKTWQFPRAPATYEAAFPLRLQQGL